MIQQRKFCPIPCSGRLAQGLRTLAVSAALLLPTGMSWADDYPSGSVTLIVPFAPGGALDAAGRLLAQALTSDLGQQFVVENLPGAAAAIGYADVAKAAKDGSKVLVGFSSTSTCSPALYSNLTWDAVEDFRPVGIFALFGSALIVHPSVEADTVAEFVAYLKEHPGELNYGSSGIGSNTHIVTEQFLLKTGTEMTHVPYKGSGDLMTDLLAGNIQVAFAGFPAFQKHVRSGALKALATARPQREVSAPDIPTIAEAGVDGIGTESWVALFVPAGTPDEVVDTLSAALERVERDPTYLAGIKAADLDHTYIGPADLAQRITDETLRCAETIKAAGITVE